MLAWWGCPAIEFREGFEFLCCIFESKNASEQSSMSKVMSRIKFEMNCANPLQKKLDKVAFV